MNGQEEETEGRDVCATADVRTAVMATTKIAALAEQVRQLSLPDQLRLAARLIEEDRSALARPIVEHVASALVVVTP